MQEIQGDEAVYSKGIVYEQPSNDLYFPMVITAFDGNDHEAFDRAGYRGRYVLFNVIEGGVQDSFTDPYNANFGMMNNNFKEFCLEVKQGWRTYGKDGLDWSWVEDGGVYTEQEFYDEVNSE